MGATYHYSAMIDKETYISGIVQLPEPITGNGDYTEVLKMIAEEEDIELEDLIILSFSRL